MIYLLWPTIRPHTFVRIHKIWMERSLNRDNISTHIAVENQDDFNIVKEYLPDSKIIISNSKRSGVCYPSYLLSSELEPNSEDIIILASDDFIPPNNWDEYVVNKLKSKGGVLMVRDGYQAPDSSNMLHPAITIPIMTGDALLKMNKIIYNPIYSHMFSDTELYLVSKDMGLLIDDRIKDATTFEHHHHAAGKRQSDKFDMSYYQNWKMDELTWNNRKFLPTIEKIIINPN